LHVTDRLSQRGGADWHLLGVLADLVRTHDVTLAVGRDDDTATAPCPVRRVPGLDAPDRRAVTAALDDLAAHLRPEIVHIHNVVNPEALEWAAGRGAVMTVQDHRSFCPGRGKLTLAGAPCREPMSAALCESCFDDGAYFHRILAVTEARLAAVRRMRAITVLSHYMKRELVAVGVDADRVHVIPPFVHGLDPSAEPDGPPCVLFAGRVVTAKGAADAVEAWRRSGVSLPLVVAGTGADRARIEADGVDVLGWVPHDRLSSLYARARAVIVSSRWQEPFGIVGIEAQSMGVPVVAWDTGGAGEWQGGGAPIPWGDIDGLAAALRDAVGARASPPAGFERDALMERLRGVYRSVAA
jgi:glycosyltransferase involved in cell wall biosynthesis